MKSAKNTVQIKKTVSLCSAVSQWSQAVSQQEYFRCKQLSMHTQISTALSKTLLPPAHDHYSPSERLWQTALPNVVWLFTAFSAARCLQMKVPARCLQCKVWGSTHWKLTPLSSMALLPALTESLLATPFSDLQPTGPGAQSHVNQ